MPFYLTLLAALSFIAGCSSKSNALPKKSTKIQQLTSLQQLDGCYLPNGNLDFLTTVLPHTPHYYLDMHAITLRKNIHTLCLKPNNKKLQVTAYDKNGKLLKKHIFTLGKEITLQGNALVFDSDYNVIEGNDAGALIGSAYKRKYLTRNTDNDLIFSDNHFNAGVALVLFVPLPVYDSQHYSYLIKRIK